MRKSKFIYSFLLSFCFALCNYAAVLNPEEPPEDVPTAPIDDNLWVLILFGLLFLFLRFKRQIPATIKSDNVTITNK